MIAQQLYKHKDVQKRVFEYCGGTGYHDMTCGYISRADTDRIFRSPQELDLYFEHGWDLGRSLWDRKTLLFHLDIEYVNFDYLAEPYFDLNRSFSLQEPVIQVVRDLLARWQIHSLQLMSGRGYHFVWQIEQDSPLFHSLVDIGRVSQNLQRVYQSHIDENLHITRDHAQAYAGMGLVMEYLTHLIKEKAAPRCKLPVEATAVRVGPGERGREMISIDISEYGDPLHTRTVRVPFSPYLKPWLNRSILGDLEPDQLPLLFMIPVAEGSIPEGIHRMQDEQKILDLAGEQSVAIPIQNNQSQNLVQDYVSSEVSGFHHWFYEHEHHHPDDWPRTYDAFTYGLLPHCVAEMCHRPNDLLQKPACIQLLTRTLMALGWHPRHIAGFIRSKYERDFGWGDYWYTYDAALRADFYVRLFSGLFAVGRDDLVDYNGVSIREKGVCVDNQLECELDPFKQSLLNRRRHEQLGRRPFNRLLL